MTVGYLELPIGVIEITVDKDTIVGVNFVDKILKEQDNPTIARCKEQLMEYFNGERKEFDLKIKFLVGTEFQKKVWMELLKIEYGKTVSYKDLAVAINKPKAARAIGGANNKNPISIIVPCHRVIGANGKLVGYANGIEKKEYLLKLEEKFKQ